MGRRTLRAHGRRNAPSAAPAAARAAPRVPALTLLLVPVAPVALAAVALLAWGVFLPAGVAWAGPGTGNADWIPAGSGLAVRGREAAQRFGLERLWQISEPVLEEPPRTIAYEPGSWGPAEVDELIAPRRWHLPSDHV